MVTTHYYILDNLVYMRYHSLKGVIKMPEIFEIIMIVSFGASWPFNVMRSYKARTA